MLCKREQLGLQPLSMPSVAQVYCAKTALKTVVTTAQTFAGTAPKIIHAAQTDDRTATQTVDWTGRQTADGTALKTTAQTFDRAAPMKMHAAQTDYGTAAQSADRTADGAAPPRENMLHRMLMGSAACTFAGTALKHTAYTADGTAAKTVAGTAPPREDNLHRLLHMLLLILLHILSLGLLLL